MYKVVMKYCGVPPGKSTKYKRASKVPRSYILNVLEPIPFTLKNVIIG